MLEIDVTTIIFQTINFVVLAVLLYFLLFKRIIQRAESRKQEIEKLQEEITTDLESAEKLKAELEQEIMNIDSRIEDSFDKAKNDLEEIRNKMLDDIRDQAEQLLKQRHEDFLLAQEQSMEDLHEEVVATSLSMAKALLQKVTTDEQHANMVKEVNDRVLEFGRKEMARVQTIRNSLSDREPIVHIETAKPLLKEQQANIIRHFSALADRNVKLEIKLDENLICGIRIRLGDYIIDHSLQSKLADIGEAALNEISKGKQLL